MSYYQNIDITNLELVVYELNKLYPDKSMKHFVTNYKNFYQRLKNYIEESKNIKNSRNEKGDSFRIYTDYHLYLNEIKSIEELN